MKIILYCQYIWGIGHFFRSLEICRALGGDDVIFAAGGLPVDASLPGHVREFRLPGLVFDDDYKTLIPTADGKTVDGIKKERRDRLTELLEKEAPDIFMVELYPFGRRAFRFELDPVLQAIRERILPPSLVVCSLRDILVEKKDPESYEKRVVEALNRYFDALLVHSDPGLLKLDETFSRVGDIEIPIYYTGFVTPAPAVGAREQIRCRLGLENHEKLIVASAGGGKSGGPLLEAAVNAHPLMSSAGSVHLQVFTGPFVSREVFDRIKAKSNKLVRVSHFTRDFLSYLAAADLSISMGGYNTSMNILAAGVPSLVWPFPGDREQGMRAEKMARLGATRALTPRDLHPPHLAAIAGRALSRGARVQTGIDLNGAKHTSDRLASLLHH